jgi:hypothetical protein
MHHTLFEELSLDTFLLQFYCFLSRGFFEDTELAAIDILIIKNIERLELMREPIKWDGRYDLVDAQIAESKPIVEKAKGYLIYKQICNDKEIANYLLNHPKYYQGIMLKDLKNLLDIEVVFRNGHMLHDHFNGYPKKNLFSFQVDCLDYVHSAAHFYNEAYDYYNNRKEIKFYNDKDYGKIGMYELRRIQTKEEVMFRNYRESYINIIFFIESFINSVGFDAYLAGLAKTNEEELNLKGIQTINPKNNFKKYSNLRQKIQNIPKVINNAVIDTETEPYKSYLDQNVELRNQYVHSSPDKERVYFGVEDWKAKCDTMINKECFAFLNAFWISCYPSKTFPKNIFNVFNGNSFKGHQGMFVIEE